MNNPANIGSISEGMTVASSDGATIGAVTAVWGGFVDLQTAAESEREVGVGAGVEKDADTSDLPEGTSTLGDAAPGYLEIETDRDAASLLLYVPLADVASVSMDGIVLVRTSDEIATGLYIDDPAGALRRRPIR